jgi:hypothetical protein
MWQASLKIEGYRCLYFNAWDTDFTQDPLVSLIGEINTQVNWASIPPEYQSGVQQRWEETKALFARFLRQAGPGLLKLGTGISLDLTELSDGLASDALSNLIEQYSKRKIEEYESEKNAILIKDHISVGKDKGKPLIFFVDELDRCRPPYALALLERMKHIFDVEGIVFVLAIDKEQLGHSLKAIYGTGLNVDGYLRRFIDLDYRLPDPARQQYVSYLFQQFNIPSLLQKAISPRYRESLEEVSTMLGWFADIYELSLRGARTMHGSASCHFNDHFTW